MTLTFFSSVLCQQLLDMGYVYFIVPEKAYEMDNSEILVLQAVKRPALSRCVFIEHVMDLKEHVAKTYMIMYKDIRTLKQA